jgi:hypothetical protein
LPSGGRGFDQDGDGIIGNHEGATAADGPIAEPKSPRTEQCRGRVRRGCALDLPRPLEQCSHHRSAVISLDKT